LVLVVVAGLRAPLVVATQVGFHRLAGRAGRFAFHAAVLEAGRQPIAISDCEVPAPESGWELRTSGLWADHVCESPFEHWSYGLEAFALALDDPAELLGQGYGVRTPLGWELEFEASGDPVPDGDESYTQPGVGHGLLLFAGREVEIEGRASRSHRWGGGAFPADDGLDDGMPAQAEVGLPTPDGVWWVIWTGGGARHRFDPPAASGRAADP
jgi:hypothetical protein